MSLILTTYSDCWQLHWKLFRAADLLNQPNDSQLLLRHQNKPLLRHQIKTPSIFYLLTQVEIRHGWNFFFLIVTYFNVYDYFSILSIRDVLQNIALQIHTIFKMQENMKYFHHQLVFCYHFLAIPLYSQLWGFFTSSGEF